MQDKSSYYLAILALHLALFKTYYILASCGW